MVNGQTVGAISQGLVALVGIAHSDTDEQVAWMAEKLLAIRLFADEIGKMNLSLRDVGGGLLLVSQFTLYADSKKGTRPSFIDAARPDNALLIFDALVQRVTATSTPNQPPITIATGAFGAMMQLHLVNDGPVTVILDKGADT